MAVRRKLRVAYGLSDSLLSVSPLPIVSVRNPTVNDTAEIGTMWINKATNAFYVLTSVSGGSSTWTLGS